MLGQAYDEVFNFEVEESRLVQAMQRINAQLLVLTHPERCTPFAFPILTDRLREKMAGENLETRITKMVLQLEAAVAKENLKARPAVRTK